MRMCEGKQRWTDMLRACMYVYVCIVVGINLIFECIGFSTSYCLKIRSYYFHSLAHIRICICEKCFNMDTYKAS